MSPTVSSWLAEAAAVFAKEWRSELRTRYALSTLGLFAVTTLITVSISLGPLGVATMERTTVMPVLLWVILLFSVMAGLPRAFVHEEESKTALALRLAAEPSAVFVGKLAYSWTVVMALGALVVPLFSTMMQLEVKTPVLLLLAVVAGGYGLAAGGTLVAAIIAQARSSSGLFAVLALPVLLPLLVLAIDLTRASVAGDFVPVVPVQLLLYDASVTVAGLMLFPVVWNP